MRNQVHMHPPVAGGDCSSCHDNHESDYPARLVQEGNALCFMCHPDKEEGIKTKKSVHVPVQASCVQCHNPHGSPSPAMLSAPVPELCANCHPNEVMTGRRAITKHAPMTDRKSCRNCHEPHYSNQPKLLITAQMALCLACHDRELETGTGRIADMKALLEKNKNAHGPLQGSDCASCHAPHGSDYWRILVKYYPSEFYSGYSDGKYALCFSCHDSAAFTERRTVSATNFRNGDLNLHFVHVNKMTKGRTCRACHEVHADSGRPHHVKEYVQFSGWTMPLNYVPGPTGGSCLPGCHGEKRYSR
jgi:predicted CXXCH cytochrome family protein